MNPKPLNGKVIVLASTLLVLPVCGAQTSGATAVTNPPSVPSALELLDQYAAAQAKFQSYYERNVYTSTAKSKTQTTSSEIWYDGRRVRRCKNSWGYVSPNLPPLSPQKPYHESRLWDGHHLFDWASGLRGGPGILIISTKDMPPDTKQVPDSVSSLQQADFLGCFLGDRERVDVVLRQATNLQVRPRLERVGGTDCYVVEAATPYGRYALWLDPQHGTNIAQATVDRRAGDRFAFGLPEKYVIKPTERHSALRSFLPTDVADGVEVVLRTEDKNRANSLPRGLCVWRGGRVLDQKGNLVLDCGLTKMNSVNPRPDGKK